MSRFVGQKRDFARGNFQKIKLVALLTEITVPVEPVPGGLECPRRVAMTFFFSLLNSVLTKIRVGESMGECNVFAIGGPFVSANVSFVKLGNLSGLAGFGQDEDLVAGGSAARDKAD